jgi:hypothetical protein
MDAHAREAAAEHGLHARAHGSVEWTSAAEPSLYRNWIAQIVEAFGSCAEDRAAEAAHETAAQQCSAGHSEIAERWRVRHLASRLPGRDRSTDSRGDRGDVSVGRRRALTGHRA